MSDDAKDAGFWNLPNGLTLARIPLLVLGIVLIEWGVAGGAIIGAALLFVGMISDFLDGYLARKMGLTSRWGAVMDPLIDKFFVLGLSTWLLMEGWLPGWCLWLYLAVLLRELAVTGLRVAPCFRTKVVLGPTNWGNGKQPLFSYPRWVS
ncbi:MAG TPA: CDP-alcohol phosphatidyltransferase family protein [Opitutales bacterium]|nr:CDP-alcohol phosphatidyltransferase family protein [Opitutales bacterium]